MPQHFEPSDFSPPQRSTRNQSSPSRYQTTPNHWPPPYLPNYSTFRSISPQQNKNPRCHVQFGFLRLPQSLWIHRQLKLQPSHSSYIFWPSSSKPGHDSFQHQNQQNRPTKTRPVNFNFQFANPHPTLSVHSPFSSPEEVPNHLSPWPSVYRRQKPSCLKTLVPKKSKNHPEQFRYPNQTFHFPLLPHRGSHFSSPERPFRTPN